MKDIYEGAQSGAITGYKAMNKFRFWCQHVLPLVYDDSLSYYEVLCKVVDYINQLIENDKILEQEVSALKIEIKKIQAWIDEYESVVAELQSKIKENANNIKSNDDDIAKLQIQVAALEKWINEFDITVLETILDKYIGVALYFGLTLSGYFVAYIPESWQELKFNTTGYDINVPTEQKFGHLTLSYK